jgi:diguanylate cyclase (GGDEF)-like protein/PAS domain S-box-containing protein
MKDTRELMNRLADITHEFLAGLPEQLGGIEAAWVRLQRQGWQAQARQPVSQQLHALSGTAASLGFEAIAEAARRLDELLQEADQPPGTAWQARAQDGMQALRQAIYTDQQVDLAVLTRQRALPLEGLASMQEKRAHRLIYMVEDDPTQATELAEQIGYYGYTIRHFDTPHDLGDAIQQDAPTAILMDISFPESSTLGFEVISALRARCPDLPPVIFLTINDRLPHRLQAVRVGGEAYFTKPVDVGALIALLDRLIFQDIYPAPRVLIIEDSRVQANYIALQLNRVGISTEVTSDPMEVIERMISFNPDLLLLDMYLPGCTGMELARVIRQMEQFVSVPIVFLSAETNKDKQLVAMGHGGDDFLTKPIEANHLITAVTTRIKRYQKLRALMNHDGLTGLLNHSTTNERLVQEVESARRRDQPLTLAMIDLDHFKTVNDTYGHATGDRVLRSLANMLKQRLRISDTIGRIGGEEFAIIMPNTGENAAAQVMRELVDGFARIRHYTGDGEVFVTFSCGIAAFPAFNNHTELGQAADRALYAAKAAGRNQVICAEAGSPHSPAGPRPGRAQTQPACPDQNLMHFVRSIAIRIDREGRITHANAHALKYFGYAEDELLGQPVLGTLLAASAANQAALEALLAGIMTDPEQHLHSDSEALRKDGTRVWLTWSQTPLLDEQGGLSEILCVGHDISALVHPEVRTNHTLTYLTVLNRISEAVMQLQDLPTIIARVSKEIVGLFDAQHVGISLLHTDGTYLEFIGNSEDTWREVPGEANRLFLAEDQASEEAVKSGQAVLIRDAMNSPRTLGSRELLVAHAIQQRLIVPLIIHGQVIGTMNIDFESHERQFPPGEIEIARIIAGAIASVIENSRLLISEQQQREYFEALVRNTPAAIAIIDLQARISSWNPAAEKLFGYRADEVIGQDIDSLLTSDENRQEALRFTQETLQEREYIHTITQRQRKDGTQADVELLAVPVIVNQEQVASMAIYHDITDLLRAQREAEAANHAKSAFLATISHEIRTPLNAIVGMTTLLLDSQLGAEQQEFAEIIRGSSDALLEIINDILDFSKIEAGKMELEEQAFDLRECIESALDLVSGRATEKGIDLAYLIDPGVPPVIISDSTRLRQILLNLLSNALKFTETGEVVLSITAEAAGAAQAEACQLHFAVRDTGIGIPPPRMERLFRSFSQVDTSTTRKYGGTGLGLAISKRLAELMQGEMWVESEGIPGKGSTFHFTILAARSSSPVPVYLHARQPELAGKRVLIVDDNATNLYLLVRQVQSWGMLPRETDSPRQALAWLQAGESFDLALLDMQMPEMDGVRLASEIIELQGGQSGFPLVMLSSIGLKEIDEQGTTFAAYLTKPIKPSVLYSRLLAVFGRRAVPTAPLPARAASATIRPTAPGPLRILLAEDILVNQKVALLMLDRIGYRADIAANGHEVLEAVGRQPYDVILMDVQMPEMDGLEATRHVRAGAWPAPGGTACLDRQPYIIAMTANAMLEDRELCLAAGMDDYLSKPIHLDALAEVLQRAAQVSEARQAVPPAVPELLRDSSPDGEVIVEAVYLRFIASLGIENAAVIGTLISAYLDEGGKLLADLRTASSRGDQALFQRSAHSLKSASSLFGARQLAALCEECEQAAQNHLDSRHQELVTEVEQAFAAVQQALLERMSVVYSDHGGRELARTPQASGL